MATEPNNDLDLMTREELICIIAKLRAGLDEIKELLREEIEK